MISEVFIVKWRLIQNQLSAELYVVLITVHYPGLFAHGS